jgi:hypothetical protein
MQMGLIARRDLEDSGLDLDKTLFVEKASHCLCGRGPRQQERLSISVPGRRPPWRRLVGPGHQQALRAIGDGAISGASNRLKKSSKTIDIIVFSLFKNNTSRHSGGLDFRGPSFMSKDKGNVHRLRPRGHEA